MFSTNQTRSAKDEYNLRRNHLVRSRCRINRRNNSLVRTPAAIYLILSLISILFKGCLVRSYQRNTQLPSDSGDLSHTIKGIYLTMHNPEIQVSIGASVVGFNPLDDCSSGRMYHLLESSLNTQLYLFPAWIYETIFTVINYGPIHMCHSASVWSVALESMVN